MSKTYVNENEFDIYIDIMNEMYAHLEAFRKSKIELQNKCFEFEVFGMNWTDKQYEKLQKKKEDTNELVYEVVKFLR